MNLDKCDWSCPGSAGCDNSLTRWIFSAKPDDLSVLIVPIKFRCNYCRQFLGISRAQAGGVVDCPTCGRSIRVPLLDGTVQPVSAPELDLDDTHLTRALDELAQLVDAPVQSVVSAGSSHQSDSADAEAENLIPQPLPEPIPIEVPLPPTPVIVTPAIDASLDTTAEKSIAGEQGLFAELAALSSGGTDRVSAEVDATLATVNAPLRTTFSPVIIGLLSTVLFVAGMLTERFVRLFEGAPRSLPTVEKQAVVDHELTGRITFKSAAGESQPDRGARILVFPEQRSGKVKLSVVGFRPADAPADQLVANAALKALGGNATTADERGAFRLPMEAGSYRILVLSHFQPREATDVEPELNKVLADYFDNPTDLLGRVQHEFAPLRIKGAGDLWDHSF